MRSSRRFGLPLLLLSLLLSCLLLPAVAYADDLSAAAVASTATPLADIEVRETALLYDDGRLVSLSSEDGGELKLVDGQMRYYVGDVFQSTFSGALRPVSGAETEDENPLSFLVKNGVLYTSYTGPLAYYSTSQSSASNNYYVVSGIISDETLSGIQDSGEFSRYYPRPKVSSISSQGGKVSLVASASRSSLGYPGTLRYFRLCKDTGEVAYLGTSGTSDGGITDANVVAGRTYTYYVFSRWGGDGGGLEIGFVDATIAVGNNSTSKVMECMSMEPMPNEDASQITWSITDGVLDVRGNGPMPSYTNSNPAPWYSRRSEITKIVVHDGVTLLGERAFYDCSNAASVAVPGSVCYIGPAAFYGCSNLASLDLGRGVQVIGDYCFQGAKSLTGITLPASLRSFPATALIDSGVRSISVDAASGRYSSQDGVLLSKSGDTLEACPPAKTGILAIPDTVQTIAESAFNHSKLQQVTIPGSVTTIGQFAFYESALTSVAIPDSVTSLGYEAFAYCDSLASMSVGSGVAEIPNRLAYFSSKLSSLTLSEGLQKIDGTSFWGTALTSVDIPSTVTNIEKNAFPEGCQINFVSGHELEDANGVYYQAVKVPIEVEYDYAYAFDVMDKVNAERAAQGLSQLTMDKRLLDAAMTRAAETAVYQDHTRPTDRSFYTIDSLARAENIAAGQTDPSAVMESWMNSSGHKANILGSSWTAMGVGCVRVNGVRYWVQLFGSTGSGTTASRGGYSDRTQVTDVLIDPSFYKLKVRASVDEDLIDKGGTTTACLEFANGFDYARVEPSAVSFASSDASVCGVAADGTVTGSGPGTATITAALASAPSLTGQTDVQVRKDASLLTVDPIPDQTYTGGYLRPNVTVRDGGKALDNMVYPGYYVDFANNLDVGTATATIHLYGYYSGTITTTFHIVAAGNNGGSGASATSVPMYRLYNPNSGEHFYTAKSPERDNLISVGWSYEGVGWTAPSTGDPVYRLYNPNAGDHHYTTSASERDALVSVGWNYEGIGWYSGGSKPLWRQYNPNAVAGAHNYTTSKDENDYLVSVGWRPEGIGWYGL